MLSDYVHKAFEPSTYSCNLCTLTHSNFGMKKEWKEFLQSIGFEKSFLYKDDFSRKYREYSGFIPPSVFIEDGKILYELISATELSSYHSLPELRQALNDKLSKL